jgi:hypothetical protein
LDPKAISAAFLACPTRERTPEKRAPLRGQCSFAAEHFSYSIRGQSQVAQYPGGMINPGQRLFGHPLVGNLAEQSLTAADQELVDVDGLLQHIISSES